MGEETEAAEAVVERHQHHAVLGELRPVVVVRRSADEGAAVDPDHHGQPGPRRSAGGREDVDRQAVFARLHAWAQQEGGHLQAGGAVVAGVAHATPWRGRLRRPPAQGSERRRGEGDVLEAGDSVLDHALQRAVTDPDPVGRRPGRRRQKSPAARPSAPHRCISRHPPSSSVLHAQGYEPGRCPVKVRRPLGRQVAPGGRAVARPGGGLVDPAGDGAGEAVGGQGPDPGDGEAARARPAPAGPSTARRRRRRRRARAPAGSHGPGHPAP